MAFAGLGADTFNIVPWALLPLAVVGAVLIVLGWPRYTGPERISKTRSANVPPPKTNRELAQTTAQERSGNADTK